MTVTERKRAARFEKVARTYGSIGNVNRMLVFLIIAVLIIDAAIFPVAAAEDQLFVIFFIHGFMLSLMSELVVLMNTYFIGDTSFIADTGNITLAGSAYSGKFLCTLPFEAKDLFNLRFIHFEKQLSMVAVSMIFLQIAAEFLRAMGYTMEPEYIGVSCLSAIFFEALLLIVTLTGMKSHYAIIMIFAPTLPLIIFCEYMDGLSEQEAAEAIKIFSPLNIFSGVPGIILMIIAAAAMAFIGELCLKHKKDVSWNIK
ncbi:MAG: hypothetical protein J1F11_03295 [Oscillospiraceae bacterium]|nr:hypothetical protein [Oscillospiraceae bacterium]